MKKQGIKRLAITAVLALLLISTTPIKGYCECSQEVRAALEEVVKRTNEEYCQVASVQQCRAAVEAGQRAIAEACQAVSPQTPN